MTTKFYILSDWFANVRKFPAGLNHMFDWEFAQTITYPEDKYNRPLLFQVVSKNESDMLVFETTGNQTYKIKIKKITPSLNYSPAITEYHKISGEGEYRAVIQEAIIKNVRLLEYEE